MNAEPNRPSPLRQRRVDLAFLAFFVVNLGFVTYFFDFEQVAVPDTRHFAYPIWPPPPVVDLVHWYGESFDPLLMARPAFWRMTIWIDLLAFGPFYACAIYAFIRGRDWIRTPALVWSGIMTANVLIILMEERYGAWATGHFGVVLAANAAWLLAPMAMIWRMRRPNPFSTPSPTAAPGDSTAAPGDSTATPGDSTATALAES